MNLGIGAYYMDYAKKYLFSYAASFGKPEFDDATIVTIIGHIIKSNIIIKEIINKPFVINLTSYIVLYYKKRSIKTL